MGQETFITYSDIDIKEKANHVWMNSRNRSKWIFIRHLEPTEDSSVFLTALIGTRNPILPEMKKKFEFYDIYSIIDEFENESCKSFISSHGEEQPD